VGALKICIIIFPRDSGGANRFNNPPIVNSITKPNAYNIGGVNKILPPYAVASQEKILIPVGTAIINVAAVK
jgi:hypothetical protein